MNWIKDFGFSVLSVGSLEVFWQFPSLWSEGSEGIVLYIVYSLRKYILSSFIQLRICLLLYTIGLDFLLSIQLGFLPLTDCLKQMHLPFVYQKTNVQSKKKILFWQTEANLLCSQSPLTIQLDALISNLRYLEMCYHSNTFQLKINFDDFSHFHRMMKIKSTDTEFILFKGRKLYQLSFALFVFT